MHNLYVAQLVLNLELTFLNQCKVNHYTFAQCAIGMSLATMSSSTQETAISWPKVYSGGGFFSLLILHNFTPPFDFYQLFYP